jgi:hypothetical protein
MSLLHNTNESQSSVKHCSPQNLAAKYYEKLLTWASMIRPKYIDCIVNAIGARNM